MPHQLTLASRELSRVSFAVEPLPGRPVDTETTRETSPLRELQAGFEAASRSIGGSVERRFTIANGEVSVRFAGEHLAALFTPAFAHLESLSRGRLDLTIYVWDSATKNVPRPALAPHGFHKPDDPLPDPTNPGPSFASATVDYRALYQPVPDLLTVLAADQRSAWFWMRDPCRLPHWECATPFRHLLSWWLAGRGFQQVHGGAVGTQTGGVLLVGRGGSGKSTTCLSALLEGGLRYAGDDYVAVSVSSNPRVHSLYSSGKVDPDHLSRLPHLAPAIANADRLETEKAVTYVHRSFPGAAIEGFPLRAILIPRITDRRTPRLLAATSAEALVALGPSTMLQLHPPQAEALARMRTVAAAVPAFVLELGSDIAAIPHVLRGLLENEDKL
jgi:hypothetical protein